MHTHPNVALEIQDPHAEELLINNGYFSASSSSLMAINNQQPAKRPTRQWAAWTRQEEENFFNALRQVGKNFEKITCRVQSKNKNQVRHYYYRLVRRMNKLLGPRLCLDAKNSKDTNAAMLRCRWSLLEKHSCTASKLHLKPRRFKMFVEALENQLLKDRNKSRRKRPCQGEKYLSAASTTSVPSKELGSDGHPVIDIQNTHKPEATKGPSLKRNMSANINLGKGGLPPSKPARQKRRPGLVASATYRRWEKAAMAGVSLVADAAEHLERATTGRNCSSERGTLAMLSNGMYNNAGEKDSVGNNQGHLGSAAIVRMCSPQTGDAVIQPPVKLKLQLFPIDENTRQALEKDACNPHLELTLSGRKRISSVLEHLNRKWGSSTIASGELMLFPYSAQQEDVNQRRWTAKDSISSASDVYAAVGSPAVFRLRYGWFSNAEPMMGIAQVPSSVVPCGITMHSEDFQEGFNMDVPIREMPNVESPRPAPQASHISEQPVGSKDLSAHLSSRSSIHERLSGDYPGETKDELPDSSGQTNSSWDEGKTGDVFCREHQEVSSRTRNCGTLSAVDWADSLTNISVGDLLSEASKAAKSSCFDSSLGKSAPFPEENQFSCDSFDAAIAAHISGHQSSRISTQAAPSSMWNAEETCDEFSFRMVPALKNRESALSQCIGDHKQTAVSDSPFQGYLKELSKSGSSNGPSCGGLEVGLESAKDISHKHNDDRDGPSKDMNLMDIYWPDSLGPLDLEMPSSRYQGQDLVFGDSNSFGCLSRMIANSLDACQNFSFFGTDKKESSGEAQGASIHLDTKFG